MDNRIEERNNKFKAKSQMDDSIDYCHLLRSINKNNLFQKVRSIIQKLPSILSVEDEKKYLAFLNKLNPKLINQSIECKDAFSIINELILNTQLNEEYICTIIIYIYLIIRKFQNQSISELVKGDLIKFLTNEFNRSNNKKLVTSNKGFISLYFKHCLYSKS